MDQCANRMCTTVLIQPEASKVPSDKSNMNPKVPRDPKAPNTKSSRRKCKLNLVFRKYPSYFLLRVNFKGDTSDEC